LRSPLIVRVDPNLVDVEERFGGRQSRRQTS
jgi:hypothetical protein